MNPFQRTEIFPSLYPFKISHESKILSVGSCFSENIGDKLQKAGFNTLVNPHGTIFNPFSIFKSLEDIVFLKKYEEKDLVYQNDKWISLHHSTLFSGASKVETLNKINHTITIAHQQIKEANVIMITFGTAFYYNYLPQNIIVANCHKIKQDYFQKNIISISEIVKSGNEIISTIKRINPNIQIIFTVSPVRHWKDGAVQNSRSKSILIESIHQLIEQNKEAYYFPAYELIIDDLRDYRFFKEDLLHPTQQAIEYVWHKFSHAFFDSKTQGINQEINAYLSFKNHRLLSSTESEVNEHLNKIEVQKQKLTTKYPFLQML